MSTPFINFLVSDMRAMDLTDEENLFHIVQMLVVGKKTSTDEQISEICHSILAPKVRRDILHLTTFPFHHMRWEEKEVIARLILPPTAPKEVIKNISERNFLRTALNYGEGKSISTLYHIATIHQPEMGRFGINPDHIVDVIPTAWMWHHAFPTRQMTSMGLFQLHQILKKGVTGLLRAASERDQIMVEIQRSAENDKDLLEAIQRLEPFIGHYDS